MEWMDIAIGTFIAMILFYYWSTSTFDFWKSRGIAGPPPKPFFGNMFNVLFGKTSIAEHVKLIYDANPHELMFGVFLGREPTLILKDLGLIADVCIRDFSTFPSRGSATFNNIEGPLSEHLFNLESTRWRPLRTKLSPSFASGKIKKMFYLLDQCADRLNEKLAAITMKDESVVECRELMAKYTMDVLGSCAFGLQMNCLSGENSEFHEVCNSALAQDWKRTLKIHIRDLAPSLFRLIQPFIIDWKMTNYFVNIMRNTIDYRKKNQIVKHDFIDLFEGMKNSPDNVNNTELTDTFLAAQLFIFLLAGYETSAIAMSNALYELAKNPAIQDKVRDDINTILAKSDGKLTYESVKSMKYLDMVFQETLRMYPPGDAIVRQSTQQYTFNGTKSTIPEGITVIIPVFAIHRDPLIYPKPEVFDPERFTDEAIKSRHSMSWLAFGEGPRQCIGLQFANYQWKIGLIKILQRYKVEVCAKTQIPYVYNPMTFVMAPNHGIDLKISKID